MDFGRKLRILREMRGVSQTDLARRLEIGPSTLAGWEAGSRDVRINDVPRIADALTVDAQLFLDEGKWLRVEAIYLRMEALKASAVQEAEAILGLHDPEKGHNGEDSGDGNANVKTISKGLPLQTGSRMLVPA